MSALHTNKHTSTAMPRIFDNIELYLLPALCETLQVTDRTDFCVGYFNLRGGKQFDFHAEKWAGGDSHCRHLLVSRQWLPHDELRAALSLISGDGELDNQTIIRLKKQLVEEFREQLTVGIPTNEDEVGLRKLAEQIKSKKVVVKLFLRNPLHTKVYLVFRPDPINPIVGYLGSSNLTLAGSFKQGELQVDVLDHDARQNLAEWFEDRWLTVGVRMVRKNLYASSKGVGHGKHSCPYTISTSRWPIISHKKRGRGFQNFGFHGTSAGGCSSSRRRRSKLKAKRRC